MKVLCALLVLLMCSSGLSQAFTCNNPDSIYQNNGDGTVTDTRTGLMWKQCSEGQTWSGTGCNGSVATHTWSDALALAEAASFAGQSDWRLPNLKELRSLVEECRSNPAINDRLFPNTSGWTYWSGSPGAGTFNGYSIFAWSVYFYSGNALEDDHRGNGRHVRLVRGGQSFATLPATPTVRQVRYVGETLPDGRYLVGAATKTWRFLNTGAALVGVKALPVAGKTESGLGIAASEIAVGDVAANAEFTVSLPIAPAHTGAPVKSSYWKLVDGSGQAVAIVNSRSGEFWLKLRTNRAPQFTRAQVDSTAAEVAAVVQVPLSVSDADNDSLTYSASTGTVVQTASGWAWQGSFGSRGVQTVTLGVSDGVESASFTLQALVRDSNGMRSTTADRLFSDVLFDQPGTDACATPSSRAVATDYEPILHLALRGIVIGVPDGNLRKFEPCRITYQSEALKMLVLAAVERGVLPPLEDSSVILPNLVVSRPQEDIYADFSWATPYVLAAEAAGMIPDARSFDPLAPVTRRWLANLLAVGLKLSVPTDAIVDASGYAFSDAAAFGNDSRAYDFARRAAFYGYMGRLGQAFNPDASMVRADVARVASRILRAPTFSGVQTQGLTSGNIGVRALPVTPHGLSFQVTGISGLRATRVAVDSAGWVRDEQMADPYNYTRAILARAGKGVITPAAGVIPSQLASSPVVVQTGDIDNGQDEVRNLLAFIVDPGSGLLAWQRLDYGVRFPDADFDGVRDDLDLWPTSTLFAVDANRNGIPDNADVAFGLSARRGSDNIVVDGQTMTIIDALLAGRFDVFSTQGTNTAFTDNGDGTVTHNLTGLVWMRCGMGQTWTGSTCTGTASTYTFDQAKALTSNFAGQSDWRLPSPWELASIVDYAVAYPGPTINSTIFPNTPSSLFWSGSPVAGDSDYAWVVYFQEGYTGNYYRSVSNHVRLVRGGQSLGTLTTPSSDFTDHGDGTVTHKKTQLTWKRCAEGQTWASSTCSGSAAAYTYYQASALTTSFAGKSDWRTPNIQELLSIVEYGRNKPAINQSIFPNTPSAYFWSGSPQADSSDTAWGVDFNLGAAPDDAYRSDGYSVRLVRGGQSPEPLTNASDCLFNWAEDNYPTLFAPSRPSSQTFGN